MKKLIFISFILFSIYTYAQPPSGMQRKEVREKIQAMAVAYITDQLDLTAKEAQQFWPVFNDIKDKRQLAERNKNQLIQKLSNDYYTITDAQAVDYINELEIIEEELHHARTTYKKDQLIAIIGAKRFLKLKKAEEDFRRKMLKEFRKRRGR